MINSVHQKYERLKHLLRSYDSVGVAYSGGIDSSLLLHAAGEALGKDRVIALHGKSELIVEEGAAEKLFSMHFSHMAALEIVELDPLTWPDFVNNDTKRCYHCKKKTYSTFLRRLADKHISVLLDGTNVDDLNQIRPGLAVLTELQVHTPLVKADIGKKDVRFLARALGLSHHSLPSNSCLATRLPQRTAIDQDGLNMVQKIEKYMHELGFTGCRVRPHGQEVVIELRQQDFTRLSQIHRRREIVDYCRREGYNRILLDLQGRE